MALSLLVLERTGSVGQTAITLAASAAPHLLGPIAGVLADRWRIRTLVVSTNVLCGLLQTGMALAALNGILSIPAIWAISALSSVLAVLSQPAEQTAIPHLVRVDVLVRANALMASGRQIANIGGYLAGGILVGWVGAPYALLIDGLTFLVAALLIAQISFPNPQAGITFALVLAEMRIGFRLFAATKFVRTLFIATFLLNVILAPIGALVPKRVLDVGGGAEGYGVYLTVGAFGLLLGSALLASINARVSSEATYTVGLLSITVALLILGLFDVFLAMLVASVFNGVGIAFVNISVASMIQTKISGGQSGLAFGTLMMVSALGVPLTLIGLSSVLDSFPASVFFLVMASLFLLVVLGWWIGIRSLRSPVTSS